MPGKKRCGPVPTSRKRCPSPPTRVRGIFKPLSTLALSIA
jgi:hypothetical protein